MGHRGLGQLTSLISHFFFPPRSKVGGLKHSRVGRVPGAFLVDTRFWMAVSFSVVVFSSGNGLERWLYSAQGSGPDTEEHRASASLGTEAQGLCSLSTGRNRGAKQHSRVTQQMRSKARHWLVHRFLFWCYNKASWPGQLLREGDDLGSCFQGGEEHHGREVLQQAAGVLPEAGS